MTSEPAAGKPAVDPKLVTVAVKVKPSSVDRIDAVVEDSSRSEKLRRLLALGMTAYEHGARVPDDVAAGMAGKGGKR